MPHYHKNKAKGVMKEGHVFTVEPMINLGSYEDTTWGDNWTAVTRDGKRSAQFGKYCCIPMERISLYISVLTVVSLSGERKSIPCL